MPTLTGVGDHAHLARPEVDPSIHVEDILGVLAIGDLRDVIRVGHSYAGTVATGVADRASGRIGGLVYLDALVKRRGKSRAARIATEIPALPRRGSE